jgi:hypothetical protein
MQVTHEQAVDMMRAIHARPGGTGALLNLIRTFEVRAAADIATLSELVSYPQLKLDLARHAADEARHAYLLLQRMGELGFSSYRPPPELDRIEGLLDRCRARDVKQVYAERGTVNDAELMELLVAAYLAERDAVGKMRANRAALEHDPETRAMIEAILRDDERHGAYLGEWIGWFEKRFSRRAVRAAIERLDHAFEQVGLVYYGALQEYFDRAADRSLAA